MTTTTSTLRAYNCAECGVLYGLSAEYDDARKQDGKGFQCPNGHPLAYGDSENDHLRRERDEARTDKKFYLTLASERYDEIGRVNRKAAARKGVITKMRHRAVAGVCQFCTQHFPDVEFHVSEMHPGELPTE